MSAEPGTVTGCLQGRVAIITGAGHGIGRGYARRFAREGASVVVAELDGPAGEAVAGDLARQGYTASAVQTDVSDPEQVAKMAGAALDRFGRIDLVMNNVGVLAVGPVEKIPLEAWQRIVDINLLGIVRSNLVFLPVLMEQGSGHIVNTASTAGLLPYGFDRLPYTATKHAVVGLSEALALYLRPHGIGVSCLCPAGVATNIVEQITFYGEPSPPRGPSFQISDAETVGESVADGVTEGRFLILTAPEVEAELRRHGADIDAYLSGFTMEAG